MPIEAAKRQKNSGSALISFSLVLLLVAICVAGYLAAGSLLGKRIAGCGAESSCDSLLTTRWAYWFGIPVSLPAFLLYSGIFAIAVRMKQGAVLSPRLQMILLGKIILTVGAGLWFFGLQFFILKSWCKFCLTAHVSAVTAAVVLACFVLKKYSGRRSEFTSGLCLASVAFSILVFGQRATQRRFFYVTPVAGNQFAAGALNFHGGRFQLNPNELPRLGAVGATNFVVSLSDATCVHCRALHGMFKHVLERYPGRLGIITLPVPLDSNCNPLIKKTAPAHVGACEFAVLTLAVWRAGPKEYATFDEWLFASPTVPTIDQARAKAIELVGKSNLDRALADPWTKRQLQIDISLYEANSYMAKDSRMPQLMMGDVITRGAITDLQMLLDLLARHSGIQGARSP
jgi:uncharacterized membrane protein